MHRSKGRISTKEEITKTKMFLAIIIFLLYLTFLFLYKNEIAPANSYAGFYYNSLTLPQHIIILIFLFLPLSFLPIKIERPSSLTIWGLYLFSYVSTCFVLFHVVDFEFYKKIILIFLLFCALLFMHITRFHKFTLNFSRKIKWFKLDLILLFFIFILLLIIVLYLINFRLSFIKWADIYNIRLAAREIKKIPFQGYFLAIVNSVLTIVGVYLFMFRKKIIYGILVILTNFAIFNFNATKTSILYPLFLIYVSFFLKKSKRITWFVLFFLIMCFLAIIEFSKFHTSFICETAVRRIFAVPGFLNNVYYDFFSNNPKVLLSDSTINFFMKPIYPLPYTHMIGLEYFNNPVMNADTGIWMAGFANFGYLGIFLVSAIGGFILGLIDNMLKKDFFYFACLICVYLGMNWTEQALHTSFLTGGVFYILLMIIFVLKSIDLSKQFYFPKQETL